MKKSQKKQINSIDVSHDNQQELCQDLSNDFGTFNALCAVDHKLPVMDTFATKLASHPLATNEYLMTKLNLENVFHLGMEVDTAASHNIISEECFNELQNRLFRKGKEKSKKLSRGVKIRLADGSMADQECPVVQIKVSTDLRDFSNPLALTFLVVKGPNNLVGRHSLEHLWPAEFLAFKQVTCKNMCQTQVSQITHVNTSVPTNIESTVNVCKSSSKCKNKNKNKVSKVQNSKISNRSGGESGQSVPAKVFPHERGVGPHLLHSSSSPSQTPPTSDQPVQTGSDSGKSDDVTRPWPERSDAARGTCRV